MLSADPLPQSRYRADCAVNGTSVVATSIRVHHLVSHHFPDFHTDFLVRLWHLGPVVLAVHDPLRPYHRGKLQRRNPVSHSCLGEGLFVFPLMLFYTAISYSVFRGKVSSTARHHQTRGGSVAMER